MDTKQMLVRLYNQGKSRKEAMKACNLRPSQIAGFSNRLNLYWSEPPGKRKKIAEPVPALAVPARALTPARGMMPAAPGPGHSAQGDPKQAEEAESIRSPGRFRPSRGFVPAREQRLKGYCRNALPEGFESMSEQERYLHKKYSEQ